MTALECWGEKILLIIVQKNTLTLCRNATSILWQANAGPCCDWVYEPTSQTREIQIKKNGYWKNWNKKKKQQRLQIYAHSLHICAALRICGKVNLQCGSNTSWSSIIMCCTVLVVATGQLHSFIFTERFFIAYCSICCYYCFSCCCFHLCCRNLFNAACLAI